MRTIRRVSVELNQVKWEALEAIARLYAREKNCHVQWFNGDEAYAQTKSERVRRDELVRNGYVGNGELQARMWEQALKDGYETVMRQWASVAERLRSQVGGRTDWSAQERHYAFWLLKDERRLGQLVCGKSPLASHIQVTHDQRVRVRNYLRRQVRKNRGTRPQVRKAKSFVLDASMYRVFEHQGRQYITVMNLAGQDRIVIPLEGETPIEGTVRLVFGRERRRIEVHEAADIKSATSLQGEVCAVDAGITEVFTDETGKRYGTEFGEVLTRGSQRLCEKGRRRNQLHQLAKKAAVQGDRAKGRRMQKYNLGFHKQGQTTRRLRTEIERQINTALNQVADERQPSVLVTEKLDLRGKAQSKQISRKVSLWARQALTERVEFKASVKGFDRKQVNPAYSSQTCPNQSCGFVHRQNRQGDRFQCLQCGHAGWSDQVAALNLKRRKDDPEITLWTPKERVKQILLARFNARLERAERPAEKLDDGTATVSGRTPDTGRPQEMNPVGGAVCRQAGAGRQVGGKQPFPATTIPVNRRAKRPLQSHKA